MKIVGIVAEYNPFHNGHLYHIKKARDISGSGYVVVIMSGHFVQRGELAVVDKWSRTKCALLAGADLVIELPVVFSCASAETFAFNAIKILQCSHIVSSIAFGAECGDIEEIRRGAALFASEPEEYKKILKEELRKGASYPAAQFAAMKFLSGESANLFTTPNNILALEYIKALQRLNSGMDAHLLKRTSHYHDDNIKGAIASATAVRAALARDDWESVKRCVPEYSFHVLYENYEKFGLFYLNELSSIFQYIIKIRDRDAVISYNEMTEGLHNRFISAASQFYTITDILSAVKTKRYTHTKISRAAVNSLLNIKKGNFDPSYIRVLGFRKKSGELLSLLKKKSSLPIIVNIKKASTVLDEKGMALLQKEIYATDIFFQASKKQTACPHYLEYKIPVVIV